MTSFNYWLLVDTVRIPDAFSIIQDAIDISDYTSLFQGCDFEYLIEQSPLLINLGNNFEALEFWGKLDYFNSSSIMLEVGQGINDDTLIEHLQKLLIVSISGKKMLFRYYTNVIWEQIDVESLVPQDIYTLLGPVNRLFWLTQNNKLSQLENSESNDEIACTEQLTLISPVFDKWV
ncbi:DUF4123 domain-containing protein [Photobacterium damselae]|uniref:DUF4123 domain-containing protein n=1 Tax=Photobacterium damselae TaxID=38293 RepID=UPI0013024B8A|nr:DUF4123 domain-containing protein [Photobacterium damselae]